MLRRIPLGNMMNLRDLGGYPLPGGGHTAWGRLLRGDNPLGLSEADAGWLLERGVRTVIDLRSDGELERRPDELSRIPGFAYHHVSMVGGEKLPNEESDIGRGYFAMLERRENPARVLRLIAQAEGGVLFHCTAGKDRTGCIAALLLSLAGVERSDVLADYQMTELYIGETVRRIRREHPEAAAFIGRSRPEYLEECLTLLETRHGTVLEYLRWLDLTDGELARLKEKLTLGA